MFISRGACVWRARARDVRGALNHFAEQREDGGSRSPTAARAVMNSRPPCVWDETELLLKASTEHRDQALAAL